MQTTVSAAEFQKRAVRLLKRSGKTPVVISRNRKPIGVLMDFAEYERLKARDSRRARYLHEVSEEWLGILDQSLPEDLISAEAPSSVVED